MLKHVDLCSGIGGFALGFGWAELSHPVLFCDIEPWSRKILAKHWPDVKIARDVKELANDPDGLVPDCDILTAGYPCQPFSVAGKQRGEEDDRHIWPEIFRIIEAKRPNWIVCENVYGHISMGLDTVLSDLETEGYSCQPFIVPACAVNAPHRRDRLWIVGYAENNGRDGWTEAIGREGAQNKQVEQFSVRGKLSRPSENVAHANSDRTERDKSENREGSGVVKNSANVAYTDNKRSQGRLSGGKDAERQSEHGHTRCSSAVHRQPTEEWWAAEPNVGRVANGVSKRVDRLKGLGNAIVPQIAMQIGLCIKQVNEQNES
jgi:DNA (cytosine-5)-methyltransferase 1